MGCGHDFVIVAGKSSGTRMLSPGTAFFQLATVVLLANRQCLGIEIVASLFFYAYGEPFFVLLMILSIIVNWRFGIAADSAKKRSKSRGQNDLLFLCSYLTWA